MDNIGHLENDMDKTFLSVKDLAGKLDVSEKTIYRMLNKGKIPFVVKIGGQWRFNTEKILKWIEGYQSNSINPIDTNIKVTDALLNGNIFYRLYGNNRDELFECLFELLPNEEKRYKDEIKKQFFYYESFMTSSKKGILQINHRLEEVYPVDSSKIYFGFFDHSLCLKSSDAIKTFMFIITFAKNNVENHIINTKIERLLMEEAVISFLSSHPNRKEIIDKFNFFEDSIFIGNKEC
jgi:PTS system nitrogen regulatory IIA component